MGKREEALGLTCSTTTAFFFATAVSNATAPAVVRIPSKGEVTMASWGGRQGCALKQGLIGTLMITGIPCSGPRTRPCRRSSSSSEACCRTIERGATAATARRPKPCRLWASICARYASTISTLVKAPVFRRPRRSAAVAVRTSNLGTDDMLMDCRSIVEWALSVSYDKACPSLYIIAQPHTWLDD